MGIFNTNNKNKPLGAQINKPAAKPKIVNADDIWNTPSPARKRVADTVTVKESKHGKAVTEKLEVESVDPEMIKSKMAQLEAELAAKKAMPVKTHADYGTSTVGREEILDAQTEYEKLYEVEHERYVKSHYEDIEKAQEAGIEEKMSSMIAEHEAKVLADQTTDFEFNEVAQAEVDKKMVDLPYAKKPEDYPEYKDIKAVENEPDQSELDKLGKIDHSEDPDELTGVDEEYLAKKKEEFLAVYGNRRKEDFNPFNEEQDQ